MVKDGTVLAIPLHPVEGTSRSRATSIPRKRGGLVAKCDISRWRSSEKRVIYSRQFVRSFALPLTDRSTNISLVFSNDPCNRLVRNWREIRCFKAQEWTIFVYWNKNILSFLLIKFIVYIFVCMRFSKELIRYRKLHCIILNNVLYV